MRLVSTRYKPWGLIHGLGGVSEEIFGSRAVGRAANLTNAAPKGASWCSSLSCVLTFCIRSLRLVVMPAALLLLWVCVAKSRMQHVDLAGRSPRRVYSIVMTGHAQNRSLKF